MILHDYQCRACNKVFEAMVTVEERELDCPICHQGRAIRVFRRFGQMLGANKGRYPIFDKQLGITLESSQHRDRVAKERGLICMGREEFDRSRHAPQAPDPLDDPNPDPQLIEIAKKAWEDVKYHRVPDPVTPTVDTESDFLDVTKATP